MISRRLAQQATRLADQNSDRLRAATPPVLIATVSSVSAGQAADGNALVSVTWRGQVVTVAGYASSYSPAVNHRVMCAVVDHQLVILARIVGYP